MDIRRLTPDDATAYRQIRIEAARDPAFGSDPVLEAATSPELLRQVLKNPASGKVLGAFEGDNLIGIVGLGVSDAHSTGTLFGLFVTPGSRGNGYGRALVHTLVTYVASSTELNALELRVQASNTVAKSLYDTEGFATEDEAEASTLRMRLSF